MAHHQADPTRLELLTQGADIGGGRFWKYTSEADEDPFIQQVDFWRGTQVRPGAGVLIVGEGAYTGTLWAVTRQGLERSGLDVIIKTLATGGDGTLPDPGPVWDEIVRDSVCRVLGCGG